MANFLTKIFGTHSSHELKKIYPIADKVDALEEQFKKLTDDELRAQINRMQMEKQYRDLAGQTNVREDDPNKELKLQRERLQLQRDVKNLKKEINSGQTFVGSVLSDAGKKALTTMATGAMLYMGRQTVKTLFNNPDLANAVGKGSLDKEEKKKDD